MPQSMCNTLSRELTQPNQTDDSGKYPTPGKPEHITNASTALHLATHFNKYEDNEGNCIKKLMKLHNPSVNGMGADQMLDCLS